MGSFLFSERLFILLFGVLLIAYIAIKRRLSLIHSERHPPRRGLIMLSRSPEEDFRNLLNDMESPSASLKSVACRRLSDETGPERRLILALLQEDKADRDLKLNAVRAAGDLALKEAVPVLGRLLASQDRDIAVEAASSLGKIGDPQGLDYLLASSERLAEDLGKFDPALAPRTEIRQPADNPDKGEPEPRAEAAPASSSLQQDRLEQFQSTVEDNVFHSDLPPLARILPPLAAKNFRVLDRNTPYNLESLDESAIIDVLLRIAGSTEEATSHRYYAIKNLACFHRPGLVNETADLLNDPLPAVRFAAADTIGRLGGREGATVLLDALKDENPYIRSAAASGLALLGDDRSLKPLIELCEDPDEVVRYSARRALGELGRRKDIGALLMRRSKNKPRQNHRAPA